VDRCFGKLNCGHWRKETKTGAGPRQTAPILWPTISLEAAPVKDLDHTVNSQSTVVLGGIVRCEGTVTMESKHPYRDLMPRRNGGHRIGGGIPGATCK